MRPGQHEQVFFYTNFIATGSGSLLPIRNPDLGEQKNTDLCISETKNPGKI
jgi:hypothetical protein